MPRIRYKTKKISPDRLAIIAQANAILEEFAEQGFDMTLRQLYYKFIARDLFPESWIDPVYNIKHKLDPDTKNTKKNYKRLGDIVGDGRMCGLIDWDRMEDRTRNLQRLPSWTSSASMIDSAFQSYHRDRWFNQPYRVEVWCEKEALIGIFATVCEKWDVPYFACRGYSSMSESWRAAMRLKKYKQAGQQPVILHFGDHDPSGIDMTHDIGKRFTEFGVPVKIVRLALNMDQVEAFSPPPNPAKSSDARFKKYVARFGSKCWELDALDPATLIGLVENTIQQFRDEKKWAEAAKAEISDRAELKVLRKQWPEVYDLLTTKHKSKLAIARRALRGLGDYQAELDTEPTKTGNKMQIFGDAEETEDGANDRVCTRCGIGLDGFDPENDAGHCRVCQEEVEEEGEG